MGMSIKWINDILVYEKKKGVHVTGLNAAGFPKRYIY